MKTAGIIAEYNPFHSGHKYQLDAVKQKNDAVIAVMSGHFTQRGGIAVTDKWTRARAAVSCGCDLVLELPVRYALSSARDFAFGAVSLLNSLGTVDTLYFGAENGDIKQLINAARLTAAEPPDISSRIREFISGGMSYPAAYAKAWNGKIDTDILSKPNNLLALEYIKALNNSGSSIEPLAIQRIGAEHDGKEKNGIACASYIRGLIRGGDDYSAYVPEAAYKIYNTADMSFDISRLDGFITGTLRSVPAERIMRYAPEGLASRVKAAAMKNYGFDAICAAAKTKRYTLSQVRRAVLASVLELPVKHGAPSYARVLAFSGTGRALLREISEKNGIDIITKAASYDRSDKMFAADLYATDIFFMCSAAPHRRVCGHDYTTSPAMI